MEYWYRGAIDIAQRCEALRWGLTNILKTLRVRLLRFIIIIFFSVNSLGFEGGYKQSRHTVSVAPIATKNGEMERDYWYSSDRNFNNLATPEDIGITPSKGSGATWFQADLHSQITCTF